MIMNSIEKYLLDRNLFKAEPNHMACLAGRSSSVLPTNRLGFPTFSSPGEHAERIVLAREMHTLVTEMELCHV